MIEHGTHTGVAKRAQPSFLVRAGVVRMVVVRLVPEDEREGAFGIVREQRSSGESPLYSSLDLSNSYICIKIRLSSLLASTV